MAFKPILSSTVSKPNHQFRGSLYLLTHTIAVMWPLSTWIALAALVQGALFYLGGRLTLLPALCLIVFRTGCTFLQVVGVLRNPSMDSVINTKFSAQIPGKDGVFDKDPGEGEVVCFHIGARYNHPMGIIVPGFLQHSQDMYDMIDDLEARSEEFGYLGGNIYTGWERDATNEVLYVMYFTSIDGIHKLASEELHRKAVDFWNKYLQPKGYIAIYHEIIRSKSGDWEAAYWNSTPTLLSATRYPVQKDGGNKEWTLPIVDATRGTLKTSKGRLGLKTNGKTVMDEKMEQLIDVSV